MLPLDFHDDPKSVLATLGPADLQKVAHLEVLTAEDLARIPPNRFALVVRDPSGQEHRKFLCDGPEHTLLSVVAFDKVAHLLSSDQRLVAGCNLRDAALLYGLRPPSNCHPNVRVLSNLVEGRLPEESVKTASAPDLEDCLRQAQWFDDYGYSLNPRLRRDFALRLSQDLGAHHLPPQGDLAKYAGEGFGNEFEGGLLLRKQALKDRPEEVEALDQLRKTAHELGPDRIAEALWSVDERCDLVRLWDRVLPDPYRTVYSGSDRSFRKVAVDELTLRLRAFDSRLREAFGVQFYEDLLKDPPTVIGALPRPDREVFDSIVGG